MDRRHLVAAVAGGAAALAAPRLASAQPRIRWRCPSAYPKSIDTLFGAQEVVARRVSEATDGAFQIQNFGPGELVPALQVMDAVAAGSVECGFTSSLFYTGKDPALAFGCNLPFGMSTRHVWSWLNQAGGREMLAPVYRDLGVRAIPAGNTGAQMGGWFRKEIRSVEDLQGLKFRIAGLGGAVAQRIGVVAQQIAPSDIYPSLERGVIDAAEYIAPYDDEKLGFGRIAPYYYYPGWQEYSSSNDFLVNPAAWEALPAPYRAVLEMACTDAWHWSTARYDFLNPQALRRLVAGGTQLRSFPREVLAALYRAGQELYTDTAARNPRFKEIWQNWDRYRLEQIQWFRAAEDPLANFLAAATSR
ncbi:ABC transporter substrate-binding protein [Roseomonas sp. NAR14]|uniref:ABC transporter substrate-binding protein n=1 Tax=Roseomonas acroporae TaxID=2937791 RepID=A0A9X1Y9C1_9PROT|nr:ABC transporter substrate-binding protein [Roseomonas acroporae]MCK8785485.1 ABC transporter substrate-binding protein [Roseomonas acroporae]